MFWSVVEYGKVSLFDIIISDPTVLGCKLLFYPGAFNMTTGPAHWEPLIRARYCILNRHQRSWFPMKIEFVEKHPCFGIADIVFISDFKHQKWIKQCFSSLLSLSHTGPWIIRLAQSVYHFYLITNRHEFPCYLKYIYCFIVNFCVVLCSCM